MATPLPQPAADALERETAASAPVTAAPAAPTSRKSAIPYVALSFLFGLGAGYIVWGGRASQPASAATAGQRVSVSADDDPYLGPASAPVTVIEFSDFSCPYCRQFHLETFGPLMETYSGRIRFVYRDYPILSAESGRAAQAAECAGDQGAYWEFHNALFQASSGLSRAAYRSYAVMLGLDAVELEACLDSGRYAGEVEADARDAAAAGVTGTPTFFINGIPLVGAQPLAAFTQVIDAEMAP